MHNKKAISAIVATVLIILITVAGVAIIWTAIVPMIQQNLAFSNLEGQVRIMTSGGYTAYDAEKKIAIVQVKRDADDGVMDKIKIIFTFEGNSYSSLVVAPEPNQMRTYAFNLSGYGVPESVSVAPVFVIGKTEKEGSITSTVTIPKGALAETPLVLLNLSQDYQETSVPDCTHDDNCSSPGTCQTGGSCVDNSCVYDAITSCINGDGCCPTGCTTANDDDCSATCSDGIQNQGEEGIDCGGPCPACTATCSDGIQNQGEEGIDCGGPCPACTNGDGSDGALTVSSLDTVVNDYIYLTGNELSGETVITINDASEFSAEDEILVMQMQNSSGGLAGQYEFADISSVNGNDITLSSALNNSYYSGTFNTTSSTAAQIVRVPQYTSVTVNSGASITASAWDGYTGGIVVFRATGTVNVSGVINVTGRGFRGGKLAPCASYQGESFKGMGTQSTSNNANAGGGGTHAAYRDGCGGGGGGYAIKGDDGTRGNDAAGTPGTGGDPIGLVNLSKLYLGGAGGEGEGVACGGGAGGSGGGIIFLSSNEIIVSGKIAAEGTEGVTPTTYYQDDGAAGGGGGAGGSIYLIGDYLTLGSSLVSADKGEGGEGEPTMDGGEGGNGSVGRIRLDFTTLSGTTNPLSYNGL